jgi:fibronectin type 3 domain-containing protein
LLFFLLLIFFASSQGYAMDVTLEWDANTEPDLAGYKVYYKTDLSGAPYDGTGATEGNSPTDVGNFTTYTLHGLTDGIDYFFVVTAHDTEGLESDYSNEVTTGSEPTPTPTTTASDGGGCFIDTAAFGSR